MAIQDEEYLDYQAKGARALSEALGKLNETLKDIGSKNGDIARLGLELSKFTENESKLKNLTDKIKEFNKEVNSGSLNFGATNDQADNLKKIVSQINEGVRVRNKLTEEGNKLDKLKADLIAGINNVTEDQLRTQQRYVNTLNEEATKYQDLISNREKLVNLLGEELTKKLDQYLIDKSLAEQAEIYKNNHGAAYAFIQATMSAKEKEAAIAAYRAKLLEEELNKNKEQLKEVEKKYGVIQKTVDFLNLEKFTLLNILKSALELNKIYTDSAKQLGLSAAATREIADNYAMAVPAANSIAAAGSTLTQTRKNELEALGQINNELGTAQIFSQERVKDQVALVKNMGIEAATAAKLQTLSLISGANNKQILDSVNERVISLRKETGIVLDNRKILGDVAKVSGQLAVQYQNNPDLIANAVVQTKQLGIELGQAANMANKLLDFENSIKSELEAELLTGKALNLEIARELSLRGDAAGAAKEMMNQVGSLADYQELNVIQQRKLAEAIGMSADELSNSLRMQDALVKSGYENEAALNAARQQAIAQGKEQEFLNQLKQAGTSEEMIAQQMQLGNQEKMNLLIDKMLETVSNLVEPFTNIVGFLVDMVSMAKEFRTLSTIIATIWGAKIGVSIGKALVDFGKTIPLLLTQIQLNRQAARVSEEKAAAEVLASSAASFGAAIPLILGVAAAALAGYGIYKATSGGGGSFSSGEESINTNTINRTTNNPNNASNNQNNKPVIVHIDNSFNVGNRGAATISTKQAISTNPYDKTN
jgi:hypothetical protein